MDALLALATPLILDANLSPDALRLEWERMVLRSRATEQFVKGEIDQETWEDVLNECGVDVIQADRDWEAGLGYL